VNRKVDSVNDLFVVLKIDARQRHIFFIREEFLCLTKHPLDLYEASPLSLINLHLPLEFFHKSE